MGVEYLLHESSVGYALFKVNIQADTIGNRLKEVQDKAKDLATFGKMVQVVSFAPWHGSAHALENANAIAEGTVTDFLAATIETNLPQISKSEKVTLGVSDKILAGNIRSAFPYIECETPETSEVAADLLRGVRMHAHKLLKELQDGDMVKASLGLGHAYSRNKVKFSINKNDNHVIQAIASLDHLDKAVNTFAMRVREWYSWHFPELLRTVSDNKTYSKVVLFVGDKSTLNEDKLHDLAALLEDDEGKAKEIIENAKASMGRDISESDLEHIMIFAERTVKLTECRNLVSSYLSTKMGVVAPNLSVLVGDTIGARLISKAGSLSNLCKYPASTVQILGAEKALFRALKTKGKTPKYGLLYNASFVGRAGQKNKGRISRLLANKCSMAARIDHFSPVATSLYGEAMKRQVEERLAFYADGTRPSKNIATMENAMNAVLKELHVNSDPTADGPEDEEMAGGVTAQAVEKKVRDKIRAEIKAEDDSDAEQKEKKRVKKEKKDKNLKKEKTKADVKEDRKKKKRSSDAMEVDAESPKKKKDKKKHAV